MTNKELIQMMFKMISTQLPIFKEVKDDIELDIINYDNLGEFDSVAYVTSNRTEMKFTVTIVQDISVYREEEPDAYESLISTDTEFLGINDIPLTDRAIILLTLLHEFGHIEQRIKFSKYSDHEKYLDYRMLCEGALNLAIKESVQNKDYNDVFYDLMPDEVYAEMFKFKYFMKFYNSIRDL